MKLNNEEVVDFVNSNTIGLVSIMSSDIDEESYTEEVKVLKNNLTESMLELYENDEHKLMLPSKIIISSAIFRSINTSIAVDVDVILVRSVKETTRKWGLLSTNLHSLYKQKD